MTDYPTYAREYLTGIADMLAQKNAAYGDSVTNPVRLFAPEADNDLAIRVRLDDKVNRIIKGKAAGEDVIADMIGYLVALQYVRRRQSRDEELTKASAFAGTGAPPDPWTLPEGWEWQRILGEWYAALYDMTLDCNGGAVFNHGIGDDARDLYPDQVDEVLAIVRRRNGL